MDWERPDWARWLGWTLLFAALLALALGTLAHEMPGWLLSLAAVAAFSTFGFPVVIGILFPEDDWRWGPLLAMALALLVLLVIPATDPARQTGIGLVTKKDQFIFVLLWGGWVFFPVLSLLYVGLAIVGIRIGRSQEARQNWDGDADFRNLFSNGSVKGPPDQ